MLFLVLSLLDIVAGGAIYSSSVLNFFSEGALIFLIFFFLGKGLWSIFMSFSAGYFFEWPGAIDVIAGLSLFLISNDFMAASHLIGGVIAIKGAYYFSRSLFGI